jgi:hypothetical protein
MYSWQGRMARGGQGLPKVSLGPAMPNPYTPCGWATPEMAIRPFWGWPARMAGVLWIPNTVQACDQVSCSESHCPQSNLRPKAKSHIRRRGVREIDRGWMPRLGRH